MMDVIVCGAPLDSSFQKDKLELVNKGSLGRRRKPSRSNLKLLLSPSNTTQPPQSPQTSTPNPTVCKQKLLVNGDVHIVERLSPQNYKPPPRIESSLPRTSSQTNYVADAQQFSIEAKLKRKKSDVGRSAVLIQTWERRTRNDSLPKRHQTGKNCVNNRFQNKENIRDFATMPDSFACPKYAENSKVDSVKNGGLVTKVRDAYSEEAMLYRMSESVARCNNQVQTNGSEKPINSQEPEWISLSRKLCAKFVEGHIEHNSADSYLHEEPDGVQQKQQVVKLIPPPQQTKQNSEPPEKVDMKKKKVVDTMDPPELQSEEPPWIHLSRKLCTKFIEEHIEYPFISPDQSVKEVSVVEPNGDLRIVEKIGKPKGRKPKARKESEPEWVSLSRKLRAKFIETHIDDPETISLDNQLNASDPEEASFESLSDTSQEAVIPKKVYEIPKDSIYRGWNPENSKNRDISGAHEKHFQPKKDNLVSTNKNDEQECSWEFQEIEFEQEDFDSLQEPDGFEDVFTHSVSNGHGDVTIKIHPSTHNDALHHDSKKKELPKFTSFAETVNTKMTSNAECYNNDVIFAPLTKNNHKSAHDDLNCNKKIITVQFVSHREKLPQNCEKVEQSVQTQADDSFEKSNTNNSFFNLTTWEEAHYKSDEDQAEKKGSPSSNAALIKEWKSMEDICDNKRKDLTKDSKNKFEQGRKNSYPLNNTLSVKENQIYKCESEDVLNILDYKISSQKRFDNLGSYENSQKKKENCENKVILKCSNIIQQRNPNSSETFGDETLSNQKSFKHIEENYESNENRSYSNDENHEVRQRNLEKKGGKKKNKSNCSYDCEYPENKSEHSDEIVNKILLEYDTGESGENKEEKRRKHENDRRFINGNIKDEENRLKNHAVYENDFSMNCGSFNEQTKHSDGYQSCESNTSVRFDVCTIEDKGLRNPEEYGNISSNQYDAKDINKNTKISQPLDREGSSENKQCVNERNNDKTSTNKNNYKCNGVIPNSTSSKTSSSHESRREEKAVYYAFNEPQNSDIVQSKVISKSENNISVNEYANINPSQLVSRIQNGKDENSFETCKKYKSGQLNCHSDNDEDEFSDEKIKNSRLRRNTVNGLGEEFGHLSSHSKSTTPEEANGNSIKVVNDNKGTKLKSKSCQDIPRNDNFFHHANDPNQETNQNGCDSQPKSKNASTIQFQEFECVADIPLCAKLVSKQNGKRSTPSVSSSNRNPSPCSESSHLYEDMFKDSTSCLSDSEASSWTVMKNNSYYVNGRSSSMNDLDLSDSCSMSVKCDYASSGSEQSTLQSRHSSYTSSSFYVNLRDYDSHMLEPSLSRKKKDNKKVSKNGNLNKMPNSNPPTPESLRHLFTSPLNSIHSPPNRAARLVNRLPPEPESHYYSTAAATSSAFKHGFDPTPPKPKKTERSSSIKIKDIAHGIILTFRRFQNHSKNSHVSPTHYVDVSHLAEFGSKPNSSEPAKPRSKKEQKEVSKKQDEKRRWAFSSENLRTDSDSGCQLTSSDIQRAKARRSSSDLVGKKPNLEIMNSDMMLSRNGGVQEKKKSKNGKKSSNAREKGKKSRSKTSEPRTIPTVTRKVQQMADGTLYLVTTVSGDTAMPGVYSDSPDTSSELSSHRPVKMAGESNC